MRFDARHWPKVALLALLVALALWLLVSGAYRDLTPDHLRGRLLALGPLSPLLFVLAFATLQPLGPSGHLFVLAAALVWPAPLAFVLSLIGAVSGQALAFAFYRYLARAWAEQHVPERLRRYEQALVHRPFRTVLILRLLAFTWPLMPLLLGASRVRFAPMLLATLIGLAPMTAVDVWLGETVAGWLVGSSAASSTASGPDRRAP